MRNEVKNFLCIALMACLPALTHAQVTCRPIEITGPKDGYPIKARPISEAGEYCLRDDIRAPRVYVFSEGGERSFSDFMLTIDASEVIVDLHGFAMNVDTRGMGGVVSGHAQNKSIKKHITIRNGTIKSRSQSGIILADMFGNRMMSLLSDDPDYKNKGHQILSELIVRGALKGSPASADQYSETNHLIERMKVESGSISGFSGMFRIAVGMKGAANIIRNSTIEVDDGHAAIYLFGPNQIIENNIIIFKGKAAVESAAPIKLHQADGTIIRNNDIIVESDDDNAPKTAISLIDSKNVVVEGNRIYGIKTLMHAWDDKSSIIDHNNDFRSMLRRPLTIGEPGVH
jgi:hypothetical protein